jgi:hypothetical protein
VRVGFTSTLPIHLLFYHISQGKEEIAEFLAEVFKYAFDVVANKKDGILLGIKEEGSPELACDKINTIASLMFYAHLAVFVKYKQNASPVTIHSHPEVDDFHQEVSGSFTILLTDSAYDLHRPPLLNTVGLPPFSTITRLTTALSTCELLL